jgi:hypothetical protein
MLKKHVGVFFFILIVQLVLGAIAFFYPKVSGEIPRSPSLKNDDSYFCSCLGFEKPTNPKVFERISYCHSIPILCKGGF